MAAGFVPSADVYCFDTDPSRMKFIQKRRISLAGHSPRSAVRIEATANLAQWQGQHFDAVIICTKCQDVMPAARLVARYIRPPRVLFLQNGLFPMAPLVKIIRGTDVCRGVTTAAVYADSKGHMTVFRKGAIYLGTVSGRPRSARQFVTFFREAGFSAQTVRNSEQAVWAKLIFSAVMNPLPIVIKGSYDSIRQDKNVFEFVREAIQEGRRAAKAMRIPLAFDPMSIVKALRAGKYGEFVYKGSMYYDLLHHRQTEIDFMIGALIQHAAKVGVQVPVLKQIYKVVKTREKDCGCE